MRLQLAPYTSALLLALCTATACTGPDNEPNVVPSSTAVGDEFGVVDEDPIDYAACAAISAAATSLIESTMTCDSGTDCEAVPAAEVMPSTCIPAVSCYIATSSQTDLEPILDELQALEIEYREECGLCPVVECLPETRVTAACEEGSCDLRARPKRTSSFTAEAS